MAWRIKKFCMYLAHFQNSASGFYSKGRPLCSLYHSVHKSTINNPNLFIYLFSFFLFQIFQVDYW